ncbi:MAG: hypothetical protein ABIC40_02835 [bacterium]
MSRIRLLLSAVLLLGVLAFIPKDAQSSQQFDATMRFNPAAGSMWHYLSYVYMDGYEIQAGKRNIVGGAIATVFDEEVNSSGDGLIGVHVRYNTYNSIDWSRDWAKENPSQGPWTQPGYWMPIPGNEIPGDLSSRERPEPLQGVAPPPSTPGGGGGDQPLEGEGDFNVLPIIESNLNYVMSESGRLLDLKGMDMIGDIIDPSRSITVRQVFQTGHPLILPDYQVHMNETWRAPFSWTIPYVGKTMEIPFTYRLSDIRTTYRFRVAAVDFNGILQFDVDTSDENTTRRVESNIKGNVIIYGRGYVDLDRGILVALCDTPILGSAYFLDGTRRGDEGLFALVPGFYAQLDMERRDLQTPLGNVIDPRQEIYYKMQNLLWASVSVVE